MIPAARTDGSDSRLGRPAVAVVLAIAAVELLRTAWISDDALITLRSVLNLVNGFGATFNPDERVQAFTHPLWFLLISLVSWITGNVVVTTLVLGAALSLLNLWLLLRYVAVSLPAGLLAAGCLLLSKAYVDYSTSGLENPLTHFLLIVLVIAGRRTVRESGRRWLALACGACGLLYLSRPDAVLLGAPFLLVLLNRHRPSPRSALRLALIAVAPSLVWSLFSLVYYGFPFPNTAYAKLGTAIPVGEMVSKGIWYLVYSSGLDPLGATVIGLGAALGWSRARELRGLIVGGIAFLAYLILVGGDFMAGRFLTPLVVASALIVATVPWQRRDWVPASVLLVVVGLACIEGTLLADPHPVPERRTFWGDVADERQYYFEERGLLRAPQDLFERRNWRLETADVRISCGGLGMAALRTGPATHFIDECALSDPLLARLPAKRRPLPRIGHFYRTIPDGYVESVESGTNRISDPSLRSYYEILRQVIRGPLLSRERFGAILRLNLGQVPRPTAGEESMPGPELVVRAEALRAGSTEGEETDASEGVAFEESLLIVLRRPEQVRTLDISLDANDSYRVEFSQGESWRLVGYFGPTPHQTGLARYVHSFVGRRPLFKKLRITAVYGDGRYSAGRLVLEDL